MAAGDIVKKSAVNIPIKIAGRKIVKLLAICFLKFINLTLSTLHVCKI